MLKKILNKFRSAVTESEPSEQVEYRPSIPQCIALEIMALKEKEATLGPAITMLQFLEKWDENEFTDLADEFIEVEFESVCHAINFNEYEITNCGISCAECRGEI